MFNSKNKKRTIQLDLETARSWYNQGGQLKEVALQAFSEDELIEYRIVLRKVLTEEYDAIKALFEGRYCNIYHFKDAEGNVDHTKGHYYSKIRKIDLVNGLLQVTAGDGGASMIFGGLTLVDFLKTFEFALSDRLEKVRVN